MAERVQTLRLVKGDPLPVSGPPGRWWYVEVLDPTSSASVTISSGFNGQNINSAGASSPASFAGPDHLLLTLPTWSAVDAVDVRLQRDA